MSRSVTLCPSLAGGVCGSAKQNSPSSGRGRGRDLELQRDAASALERS